MIDDDGDDSYDTSKNRSFNQQKSITISIARVAVFFNSSCCDYFNNFNYEKEKNRNQSKFEKIS